MLRHNQMGTSHLRHRSVNHLGPSEGVWIQYPVATASRFPTEPTETSFLTDTCRFEHKKDFKFLFVLKLPMREVTASSYFWTAESHSVPP